MSSLIAVGFKNEFRLFCNGMNIEKFEISLNVTINVTINCEEIYA